MSSCRWASTTPRPTVRKKDWRSPASAGRTVATYFENSRRSFARSSRFLLSLKDSAASATSFQASSIFLLAMEPSYLGAAGASLPERAL